MANKTYRTHTTVAGQNIYSPRFEKKSEQREWLEVASGARKNFRDGKELTARQRQMLQSAGFKFQIQQGDIFVNDLAAKFLKMRAQEYVSGTASPNYDHLRKYILPEFGKRNVYGIKPSEIRRFLKGLKYKKYVGRDKTDKDRAHIYKSTDIALDEQTTNRIKVTLSLLFDYAIEEELVGDNFLNPVPKTRRRGSRKAKSSEKIKIFRTQDEIDRFMNESKKDSPMMRAFNTTGINSGPRKSEKLGSKWADYDFKNRRIRWHQMLEQSTLTVVPRTKAGAGKERTIAMNDAMFEALTAWRKVSKFNKDTDYVFCNDKGEPFSPREITDLFVAICKAADVPNIGIHGLRHTFGTWFIMNGGTIDDLKLILGHSSTVVTQKYVHLAEMLMKAQKSFVNFSSKDEPNAPT